MHTSDTQQHFSLSECTTHFIVTKTGTKPPKCLISSSIMRTMRCQQRHHKELMAQSPANSSSICCAALVTYRDIFSHQQSTSLSPPPSYTPSKSMLELFASRVAETNSTRNLLLFGREPLSISSSILAACL